MSTARPARRATPSTALARRIARAMAAAAAALALAACASAPPLPPLRPVPATEMPDISPVPERPVASGLPAGWRHGVFMEVFVRGYQDSDGDGIGDLKGLTQRLDYLQRLGVRGLWLMPVTASTDHDHGYWVGDFRGIERDYGTWADLDTLVREAHRRGIAIVVDYVINHAARDNPLFRLSAASRDNPFRDWFVWADAHPRGWEIFGHDPWTDEATGSYFGQFGGEIPDFNLRHPRVVQYHDDSLRLWLNHGVDGFRIDAVGHLFENGADGWSLQPENYPFMRQLRERFAAYGERVWVCESPGDAIGFGREDACGGSFAFGLSDQLVKAARGDAKAVQAIADYWKTAPSGMATMVSNHDAFAGPRLMDAMGGDESRVRLAAATYLLQPGTPYLYYGEELGMDASPSPVGDHRLRGPMSWTGDARTGGFTRGATPFRPPSGNVATHNAEREDADPRSLLNFYRSAIALRNARPSLAVGDWHAPQVTGRVLAVQRRWQAERTLVVANYGDADAEVTVTGLDAGRAARRLWSATAVGAPGAAVGTTVTADAAGSARVRVPARGVEVYTLD